MSPRKKRGRKVPKSVKSARKKTISVDDLQRAVTLLGDQSSQFAALATLMTEHALGEIEIDGAGLFDRGIDKIDRYIDNLNKGAAKARREKERSAP